VFTLISHFTLCFSSCDDSSLKRFFAGVWSASSVTTDVTAPCGPILFGGNATLLNARKEISAPPLVYKSRFISDGNKIIADREYNVRGIASATMGANSVLEVSLVTPNKFSCLLEPVGANNILSVDLLCLARRQETIDDRNFHCTEVVRQIVSSANENKPKASMPTYDGKAKKATGVLLKEIETISLYTAVKPKQENEEITEITCQQRSATFLLPSNDDPIAYQAWQLSRGRPIDVRFYNVTYTKRA
jgi:hypothetical protein